MQNFPFEKRRLISLEKMRKFFNEVSGKLSKAKAILEKLQAEINKEETARKGKPFHEKSFQDQIRVIQYIKEKLNYYEMRELEKNIGENFYNNCLSFIELVEKTLEVFNNLPIKDKILKLTNLLDHYNDLVKSLPER